MQGETRLASEHAEEVARSEEVVRDSSGESAVSTAVVEPFVGQWNQLVSHTNWEKGRIICDWRAALEAADAPAAECSDEAWSRIVGNVTPQHVGRLRRVFQRFHGAYEQFSGLHWSHFFAALDWVDAEMWLEGASQNGWSVSETRRMRQETLGAVATEEDESDAMDEEMDEDSPVSDGDGAVSEAESVGMSRSAGSNSSGAAVSEEEEDDEDWDGSGPSDDEDFESPGNSATTSSGRPFADLPELPDDLADAFDAFKLAILAHKTTGWDDVKPEQVIASLDALKKLVGS